MLFDDDFDEEDFDDPDFDLAAYEQKRREDREKLQQHPLFQQAKEILQLVNTLLQTATDDKKAHELAGHLRESALMILGKLAGALPSGSYIICMQNAAIIRDHAETLRLSNHLFSHEKLFEEQYIKLFRKEMETFRHLFREWAADIHEMEPDFEDEDWGLFLK